MIRVLSAEEMQEVAGDVRDAGFGSIDTVHGYLPLVALDVDARIEGLTAATTVRQQFRNVFDEPLEATYIFPLPPRAAVTGFRMTVNDSVVEGRIDERGRARADYVTAIAEGRAASIAEQERADVFTLRVGNIPPRSDARVELTLAAPVAIDSLEATYRFPLVVAPRYCPGAALAGEAVGDGIQPDTDLVPDASRISPPVLLPGFTSPVRLGIRVRIAAGDLAPAPGNATASLGCSLPATEAVDGGGLTVSVMPGQRLDRDFILRFGIATDAVATTSLLVEPDASRPAGLGSGKAAAEAPGDGTFSLVIVPPAREAAVKRSPRDVVFLLDRSGSMGGWKLTAARRALARMIDTLTADDRVAVLAFDDVVEHRGEAVRLAPATDRQRWSLLEWLGGIAARGGTELTGALETALGVYRSYGGRSAAAEAGSGRERLFVVITDCQVGDDDRVIGRLVDDIGDVTFFVVGIDTAINEGLLSRMADSTGGMAEMVESEERLDAVMDRIQQRLATPLVTGLTVRAAGLDIIQESLVPAKVPNLVPGVPVVVRGRYRGRATGGVAVDGRRASGAAWREQATATQVSTDCHGTLWARGRLQHLENLYGGRDRARNRRALEKRMVELSTAFGVLCRFTALLAIDPRHPDKAPVQDSPRRIIQPVERAWPSRPSTDTLDTYCVHSFIAPSWHWNSSDSFAMLHRVAAFYSIDDVLTEAARILAQSRPASGDIRALGARKVASMLRALRKLLDALVAAQAPGAMIDALSAAHDGLLRSPKDPDAASAALDALADVAAWPAADRWWRPTAVGPDAGGSADADR